MERWWGHGVEASWDGRLSVVGRWWMMQAVRVVGKVGVVGVET